MEQPFIQRLIDRAVKIATKSAINGHPVSKIVWMPSNSAAASPYGIFAIEQWSDHSASTTPPWEE